MNAAGHVRRSGPGLARVLDRLRPQLEGLEVTVGIQSTQGAELVETEDGAPVNLATVATVNEYGSADGRIPSRPFMRTSARRFGKKWLKAFRLRLKEAIVGRRTVVQAASIVGNIARADVQMTITRGPWKPNAPYTIARKGSTRPLIDTGQMRQSIRYEVSRRGHVEDVG